MADGGNNNKRRISQVSNTSSAGIPLKNRFDPLLNSANKSANTNEMDLDPPQGTGSATQSGGTPLNKKKKPPPVIVEGTLKEGNTTLQALKGLLQDKFQFKYANGKTSFYTNTDTDHKKLKEYFISKQFEFHTYTLSSEKLTKLILKGLPPSISTDDIKEELTDLNFSTIKINQINQKQEYPLYSVLFSPGTKTQDVVKIRTLCYCIVSWEKPHKKVNPIQCFKCQKFHHIANNCTRKLKCRKCAGDHHIKDCLKEEEEYECANCNEKHPANSKECEIFMKVAEKRRNVLAGSRYPSQPTNQPFSTQGTHWPRLNPTAPTSAALNLNSSQQQSCPTPAPVQPCTSGAGNIGTDSISSIIQELKSLFTGFNLFKILTFAKSILSKIRRAPDGFSKFTIILDSICEFFDG